MKLVVSLSTFWPILGQRAVVDRVDVFVGALKASSGRSEGLKI